MTYETVRDAAKELALNAIAIEKRDNSDSAAKIAVEAIRIHEQFSRLMRRTIIARASDVTSYIDETISRLAKLDSALM